MVTLPLRTLPARRAARALAAVLVFAAVIPGAASAAPVGRSPSSARALVAAVTPTPAPTVTMDQFMWGIAQAESSGRYDARSGVGAYGKYQIMPDNWPNWARRYIGTARAAHTAENQERIARGRFMELYDHLGSSWPRVAYWWLSGHSDPDRTHWSASATRYVERVMRLASSAPPAFGRALAAETVAPLASHLRTATRALMVWRRVDPYHPPRTILAAGMTFGVLGTTHDQQGGTWIRIRVRDGRVGWVPAWFTRPV